jgi:hypothetical protein
MFVGGKSDGTFGETGIQPGAAGPDSQDDDLDSLPF